MEIWEKHKDFNDYEFSNHGRLKRIDTGYILKETLYNRHPKKHATDGYFITFILNTTLNKRVRVKVHRIVAELFVANPDPINKTSVNHIDGVKNNNHHTNLEWVSVRENNLHSTMNNLNETSKKISVDIVRSIRKDFATTNITIQDLITKYDYSGVHSVVTYKVWAWVDPENKIEYLKSIEPKLRSNSLEENFKKVNQETKNSLMKDYVNGMSIISIADKYSLSFNIINMIIDTEDLPLIDLLSNEEFKVFSDEYQVSNMGRIIKNNRIKNKKSIAKLCLSEIVATLFLIKPTSDSNINIINKNKPYSIYNLEWIEPVFIDEKLIIEEYTSSITTRQKLAKKI